MEEIYKDLSWTVALEGVKCYGHGKSSQGTDRHPLCFSRLGLSEVTGQAREDAAVTARDICRGWDCAMAGQLLKSAVWHHLGSC